MNFLNVERVNVEPKSPLQALVVASFTEIKTGYRGFETNEIRYFVCLLLAVIYFSRDVHEPELATGNGFREILKRM